MAILKVFILIVFLFATSCGLVLPGKEPGIDKNKNLGNTPLTGNFIAVDGTNVVLEQESNFGQVLFFVSETCSICRRETITLATQLREKGSPTNIRFYSILVGSYPADAQDWKNELNVTWVVGTDNGDSLFRKYCPEGQTPCAILRNPNTNISTKLIGETNINTWPTYTGEWSY